MMMPTRALTPHPPAISYARFAKCLASDDGLRGMREAAEQQRGVPQVAAVFDAFERKTAIPAGNTLVSGWAGALMESGVWSDVLTVLRDFSVFDALAPRMRRGVFKR